MRRRLLIVPALALVLAACGGGDGDGGTTIEAVDLIRSSPQALEEAGTARLAMTVVADGQEIEAEGQFDFANQTGAMTMALPAPVSSSVDIVFDGTTYFMSTEAFDGGLAVDADWVFIDVEAMSEQMGIDLDALEQAGAANNPTSALGGLEGVAEDGIEELGTEEVRGVETRHYAAEIDMQAVLEQAQAQLDDLSDDLPEGFLDEEAAEQFEQVYGDEPVPVEIWIDDDGLTRRMTMELAVDGEEGSMTMEMYDYGEPVDIEIPDESDAIDLFELLGPLGGN